MKFDVKVRPHNKQCYADIVRDLAKKKTGPVQFQLRVNGGNIVDYVKNEVVSPFKKGVNGRS